MAEGINPNTSIYNFKKKRKKKNYIKPIKIITSKGEICFSFSILFLSLNFSATINNIIKNQSQQTSPNDSKHATLPENQTQKEKEPETTNQSSSFSNAKSSILSYQK